MAHNILVQLFGYSAQALFGIRFFIQLYQSEKSGKVLSPLLFWQISLLASALLLIYSILVRDMPVMLGQLLGYVIYIRNLLIMKEWQKYPDWVKWFIRLLPIVAFAVIMSSHEYSFSGIIENNSNLLLLTWGLFGQAVFASRFIYQWVHSEKKQESLFPPAFWILSITGAVLISSYAWYMHLYPIIIGHAFGMIVYVRNLMIHFNILSRHSGGV